MCAHSSYALPCNFDLPQNVVREGVPVLGHMRLASRPHCRKRACALGFWVALQKVLQIVRIVLDEAMTCQGLVQVRARVMHSVRARCTQCAHSFLNESRLMRPCMHCHVQARMCLRMRSRVHLNLACVRLAYMRAQAIARSMGLPKNLEPNHVPI